MKELEIIAAAIMSRDKAYSLFEYSREIFQNQKVKTIYDALSDLYELGHDVDIAVLRAYLESKGQFDKIGGDAFLATLLTTNPIYNIEYCLSEMDKARKLRELQSQAKDLFTEIKKGGSTYEKMLSRIVEIHDELNKPKQEDEEMSSYPEKKIEDLFPPSSYLKTGIGPLDEMINGIFNGQLVVIAARQKRGKSAFALQIARHINDVLLFSLEMKKKELYARILSSDSGVEAWKIEARKYNELEYEKINRVHNNLKNKIGMTVIDNTQSYKQIISIIKKTCETKKPKAIFIDYLQLFRGAPGENQNLRIAGITGMLKNMAMTYSIPIVLLSQLSRESEKENRAPIPTDLRDSGAIEQDADVLIFLHETPEMNFEIIVAENRKGRRGKIQTVLFNKPYMRFECSVLGNPKKFDDLEDDK